MRLCHCMYGLHGSIGLVDRAGAECVYRLCKRPTHVEPGCKATHLVSMCPTGPSIGAWLLAPNELAAPIMRVSTILNCNPEPGAVGRGGHDGVRAEALLPASLLAPCVSLAAKAAAHPTLVFFS